MGYKVVKVICSRSDELKGSIQRVELFYTDRTCNPRCNVGELPNVCISCAKKLMRLYEQKGLQAFDEIIDVNKLP